MGWRSKAEKAKKGHRPSLKNWACDNLHQSFPPYRDGVLAQSNLGYETFVPFSNKTKRRSYHYYMNGESTTSIGIDIQEGKSMIPARIDARVTPPSIFHSEYEAKLIPTVITHIPQGFDVPPPPPSLPSSSSSSGRSTTSKYIEKNNQGEEETIHAWKALSRWDLKSLASDDKLRERMFKVGEDDNGKTIKMKLKHFIRYLEKNVDDSPLYVFDSSFEDDRMAKQLLSDYRVPTYFNEDLFHLVGEKRRPPYRWFLVGPERSGTCVHIDPLATSAWNTLLVGRKRWVLFPPHVPKSIVKGSKHVYKGEDDEAIHYFTKILPRIKKAAVESGGKDKYESFECYEFTQYENETVFIPNGWWHAVLNLTDTVGITQNFCSHRNFDQVWIKTRTGRKKMASKWLNKLGDHYPHLASRARELNKRDNFVMKYDPEIIARRTRRNEKRAKKERKYDKEKKQNRQFSSLEQLKNEKDSRLTSSTDKSCNRDAKRSRVERVVSPDFSS